MRAMKTQPSSIPGAGAAPVEIVGAGPAGLAAALTVVRAGGRAQVYEMRRQVGGRFHGDFQGLENWTRDADVLEEFEQLGIAIDFEARPFYELTCFDPTGRHRTYRAQRPLFYLIRRGSGRGTLDTALVGQALAAGVELELGARREALAGGIVTVGPRRGDAIASGYVFETDMADGAYAVASDTLAPKGYGYLLISGGRGTVASCMFRGFDRPRQFRERCVEFFRRHVGLRMVRPRPYGGIGNFYLPRRVVRGGLLFAGEAAGIQDPLFGFGMRWAVATGAAAAHAALRGQPQAYADYWSAECVPWYRTAVANRWFYERLGDRGYRWLLGALGEGVDAREWLSRRYRPKRWKGVWGRMMARSRFREPPAPPEGCRCTACGCQTEGKECPTEVEHHRAVRGSA